jgi:putative transposase
MKTYKFKVRKFHPLSDNQWANIQDLVEKTYTTGRPRKVNLRSILDGLRFLVRTGCQWRNMDEKYGKMSTLRYYFDKWTDDGTWSLLLKTLVLKRRGQLNRQIEPSLGAIDSQSIKLAPLISQDKGFDGNKQINGRKRHLIVDSQGLPLAIHLSAANEADGKEGIELLAELQKNYKNVKKLTADAAYRNSFQEAASWCDLDVEISQKPESQQGFVPQKNRWQVERSFAWLNFYRRLSKDYEKKAIYSVSMIKIAFISVILNHF